MCMPSRTAGAHVKWHLQVQEPDFDSLPLEGSKRSEKGSLEPFQLLVTCSTGKVESDGKLEGKPGFEAKRRLLPENA